MSAVKHIEVNGQSYPVRYDINALCEFEDITGKSLISGIGETDIRSIRALVFVGLKSGHDFHYKGITKFTHTINEVGQWLNLTDGTVGKFMEALNDSLGIKKEASSSSQPGE
jgi:hypothetical protein